MTDQNQSNMLGGVPREIAEVVLKLGRAEWGATKPRTAKQHAVSVGKSVRITAEHFGQTEPQAMHGLYCQGDETIICHTGTSPNSPNTARALTGAWNHLHDLILAAVQAETAPLSQEIG